MPPRMQVRAIARVAPAERPELRIRRIDAIPVALPLAKPMAMSGVTVKDAENLLVRIEAADGTLGWGEAASAPTMTGDTLAGLVAAVREHLRSEEHTSELQSHLNLVCRLLLEKKKIYYIIVSASTPSHLSACDDF